MFSKYEIKYENGEQVLYLQVDFNYETSQEFGIANQKSLLDQIKKYVSDHHIPFLGRKVCLVASGVLISLMLFSPLESTKSSFMNTPIIASNSVFQENFNQSFVEEPSLVMDVPVEFVDEKIEKIENILQEETSQNSTNYVETHENISSNPKQEKPVINQNSSITQSPSKEESNSSINETTTNDIIITLIRSNGTVIQIGLEDYVVGVVAGEMPASFQTEALKAQAVVARTYALRKYEAGYALSDTTNDQVYKDKYQQQAMWQGQYDDYHQKIVDAVMATKGQVITYQGQLIDAVYFSNSNGYTEDAINVWHHEIPYLKSVESSFDIGTSAYSGKVYKSFDEVQAILGYSVDATTGVEIISRTISNRIDRIKIKDHIYTGLEMRNLFQLRSTDFDIVVDEDGFHFTTRGYGHGVGMSQYGANGMANMGYSYQAILHYYYKNVVIDKR